MVLGNLIGGFITILVGATLIPAVANDVYSARYDDYFFANGTYNTTLSSNVTGTTGTILGLTTLFFALGVMAAGVALAVNGLKNAGVL